jgi:hypothetical protein
MVVAKNMLQEKGQAGKEESAPEIEDSALKQQSFYIYLPSLELANEWRHEAALRGMSMSQFVVDRVTSSRSTETAKLMRESKLWNELIDEVRKKNEDIEKMRLARDYFRQLSERLQDELYYCRSDEL